MATPHDAACSALHDGLHITGAATATAEHLRTIEADRESRRATLVKSAKTARDLLEELTAFWHRYPNPRSLEAAKGRTAAAHAAAEKKLSEQTRLAGERQRLEQQAETARTQAREARTRASLRESAVVRLAPIVETEKGVDEYRDTVKTAIKREVSSRPTCQVGVTTWHHRRRTAPPRHRTTEAGGRSQPNPSPRPRPHRARPQHTTCRKCDRSGEGSRAGTVCRNV